MRRATTAAEGAAPTGDPSLAAILERLTSTSTSLMSEYSKQQQQGIPAELRAEFTLIRLNKQKQVQDAKKARISPRAQVLQEQLRKLDEKHKTDMSIIDDVQDFIKARARLEMEFAHNLQKLSQQFVAKRKWPPNIFNEGHENILLIDLYRQFVNSVSDDAKLRAQAAEKVTSLASETLDAKKEERRNLFRTGLRVLSNLQEELSHLDISVANAKKNYDAAMKELQANKKKGAKASDKDAAKVKSLESKARFSRTEYLLELSAANQQYLKFRNEQLPEVLDTVTQSSVGYLSTFFKSYLNTLTSPCEKAIETKDKLQKAAGLMSVEYERRTFIHENRHEFPGRQLYDMEPYGDDAESRVIEVDDASKHILAQMRNLLRHSTETLSKELETKEEQIMSLLNLYEHYSKAGAVLDKSQNQSQGLREKMEQLYDDIESVALKKALLDSKIARITEAGVDENVAPSSPLLSRAHGGDDGVVDIAVAQQREENRRRAMRASQSSITSSMSQGSGGRPAGGGGLMNTISEDQGVSDFDSFESYTSSGAPPPPPPPPMQNAGSAPHPDDIAKARREALAMANRFMEVAGESEVDDLVDANHSSANSSMTDINPPNNAPPVPLPNARPDMRSTIAEQAARIQQQQQQQQQQQHQQHQQPTSRGSSVTAKPSAPPPTSTKPSGGPPPPAPKPAAASATSTGGGGIASAVSAVFAKKQQQQQQQQHHQQHHQHQQHVSVAEIGGAAPPLPPPPSRFESSSPVPPPSPLHLKSAASNRDADVFVEDAPAPPPLPPPPADDEEEQEGAEEEEEEEEDNTPAPPPLPPVLGSQQFSDAEEEQADEDLPEEESIEVPMQYRALYEYRATQHDDLSLSSSEVIYVLVVRNDGWCQGINLHGQIGFFPHSYVNVVDNPKTTGCPVPHVVTISPSTDLGFTMKGEKPVTIDTVKNTSAAYKAGLRTGDMILELNGEPCGDKDSSSVTKMIFRAGPHAPFRLCVLNRNDLLDAAQKLTSRGRRNSHLTVC